MINLTEAQAKQLVDTSEITVIQPLREQPPKGYKTLLNVTDAEAVHFSSNYSGVAHTIKLRYPVGKAVGCRERAALYHPNGASCKGHIDRETIVIANRVCPVQEITDAECTAMRWVGFTKDETPVFDKVYRAHRFNLLYSKPQPRVVAGKLDHYVCWAWNWGSWEYSLNDNYTYCDDPDENTTWHYWNNLPLTVHTDPWVEVAKLKLERV